MEENKQQDCTEKSVSLGEMCYNFETFIRNCDFTCFKNLTPIVNQLNLLEIKKGYELDAFEMGDDYGSRYQIYCCKENSTDRYEPTQKEIVPKEGVDKITEEVKKDVHIPYNDSQYIEGRLSRKEAQDVPYALPYFKVPFTREGIMQAWLLNSIPDFMPKTWHACYGARNYIYNKESVKNISYRRMSVQEQLLELDIDSLLPNVVVEEDKAVLKMVYWSDWAGLVQMIVDVAKDGSSVCFSEPNREVLIEYHCGIRF